MYNEEVLDGVMRFITCADLGNGKQQHGVHFRASPAGWSYGTVDTDLYRSEGKDG